MITENEKKVLRFLLAHFDRDQSINQIAKECGLAPNGAYEILRKLQKQAIVKVKSISNIKSYKMDFMSNKALRLLGFILVPNYDDPKIRYRYNDLIPLEQITRLCVLFGSYITSKKVPNDIDILFVLEKSQYKKYERTIEKVKMALPLKLHDVIQTRTDLRKNIQKGDPLIIKIITEGVVLWGEELLVEVIKSVAQRKA